MSRPALNRFNSTTGEARIVVITTGGTIVQQFDKESGIHEVYTFLLFYLN